MGSLRIYSKSHVRVNYTATGPRRTYAHSHARTRAHRQTEVRKYRPLADAITHAGACTPLLESRTKFSKWRNTQISRRRSYDHFHGITDKQTSPPKRNRNKRPQSYSNAGSGVSPRSTLTINHEKFSFFLSFIFFPLASMCAAFCFLLSRTRQESTPLEPPAFYSTRRGETRTELCSEGSLFRSKLAGVVVVRFPLRFIQWPAWTLIDPTGANQKPQLRHVTSRSSNMRNVELRDSICRSSDWAVRHVAFCTVQLRFYRSITEEKGEGTRRRSALVCHCHVRLWRRLLLPVFISSTLSSAQASGVPFLSLSPGLLPHRRK